MLSKPKVVDSYNYTYYDYLYFLVFFNIAVCVCALADEPDLCVQIISLMYYFPLDCVDRRILTHCCESGEPPCTALDSAPFRHSVC